MVRLSLLIHLLAPALAAAGVLSVVFTNDVGGRLESRDLMGSRRAGGAPALRQILAEIRQGRGPDEDVLLVDSGDFLYSTRRASDLRPSTEWMNQLGFDAAGIGNHELDRGPAGLRLRALLTGFPMIGSNLRIRGRFSPPAGIRSSLVLDLPHSGTRVGILSVLDPELVPTHPGSTNAGLSLMPVEATLERELQRLEQSGARVIVLLSHQGVDRDLEVVRRFPGRIHLVVGGHYPSERVEVRVRGSLVVQAQSEARELGRARFPIATGRPDPAAAEVEWIPWASRETALDHGSPAADPDSSPAMPLAHSPRRRSIRETLDWILDAMLQAARTEGRSPIAAILNRGAIRAGLPEGTIDSRDLLTIAPFDNDLVVLEVPASRLRSALSEATGDSGTRDWVLYPADPSELPTRGWVEVVVNDWLAEGRDGRYLLRQARARRKLGPSLVRLLEERIVEGARGE